MLEEREQTKRNTISKTPAEHSVGAQATTALDRVCQLAQQDKERQFTALLHHINPQSLKAAYWTLNPKAAKGIDGVTWVDYGKGLDANIEDLHRRIHTGAYRPSPTRRTFIPKANGQMRPLGIITLEDKIAQRATAEVWVQWWRQNKATGDMIAVCFADDFIAGFQHESDAQQFQQDLEQRLKKYRLELSQEKTRLIEFGRWAARKRKSKGQSKPETRDFLGFTHICATSKKAASG